MNSFFKQLSTTEKFVFFVIIFIYVHNLFLDIMQVDAMQYAGISHEMSVSQEYLQVKEAGNDYLDKPPFLFWISSFFISIFGVHNFGYKIGPFLFVLLSLYAVYKFSRLYYSEVISKNAVLILASTQAYFLITNDVRTDGILASCVITATWLFAAFFEFRKLKYLVFGSVFIGIGLLTKGPIAIIVILFPIGINLIYHKKWSDIFNVRWILVLFIIAIILLPMSYGLYQQFDLHPEKVVNGKTGESGLYFYYWLQSFGRITGENVWNNGLPWHFFLGSIFWDFFPWVLPLYIAVIYKIKSCFDAGKKFPEVISIVGFVTFFSIMSLSKYKLPHYVFGSFTFASIILSNYFSHIDFKTLFRWKIVFYVFGFLILVLIIAYPILFFTEFNLLIYVCIVLQMGILWHFKKSNTNHVADLLPLVLVLNIFLSFVFYPKLLTFQADSMAGKWAKNNLQNQNLYAFERQDNALNFYAQKSRQELIKMENIKNIKGAFWIYVSEENLRMLKNKNVNITKKVAFADYPITKIKLNFLLSEKRATVISYKYLIQIINKESLIPFKYKK